MEIGGKGTVRSGISDMCEVQKSEDMRRAQLGVFTAHIIRRESVSEFVMKVHESCAIKRNVGD